MSIRKHGFLACALVIAFSGPAAAQEEEAGSLLLKTFPRGEEVCYGRVYDAAHLARHPRQRMSAFHFFKSLTPDPLKEEGYRDRKGEIARDRKEAGARWLSVLVRFKDTQGKLYKQEVECQGGPDQFYCRRDCDGGGFLVRPSSGGLLLSQEPSMQGLRLAAACDPDEEGEGARLDPKEDVTLWALEPLPMSACHAERDAARPTWARTMEPLSARFTNRDRVCHARIYNAEHLARHPNQKVVAVMLRTEDRVRWDGDTDDSRIILPVRLSARLRDGAVATRSAVCTAHDYELTCNSDNDVFTLIRAGERGLVVRDINARKLIDPNENFLSKFLQVDLGDDDRVFRLDEQENANCEIPR